MAGGGRGTAELGVCAERGAVDVRSGPLSRLQLGWWWRLQQAASMGFVRTRSLSTLAGAVGARAPRSFTTLRSDFFRWLAIEYGAFTTDDGFHISEIDVFAPDMSMLGMPACSLWSRCRHSETFAFAVCDSRPYTVQ